MAHGGANRRAPGQTVREQVGDGSELVRALLGHEPYAGTSVESRANSSRCGSNKLVPVIDLFERGAEAPVGLGDPRPRRGIRKRVRSRTSASSRR